MAGGIAALGMLRPSTVAFVLLLAVVGIGLGLFTPPNNAAVVDSVPREQSGLASGVLNMTRRMGSRLRTGSHRIGVRPRRRTFTEDATADHVFSVASLFLAGVALFSQSHRWSTPERSLGGTWPWITSCVALLASPAPVEVGEILFGLGG